MGNMSRQIQFGLMAIVLFVLADDGLGSIYVNLALYLIGGICLFMSFRYADKSEDGED